MVRSRRLGRPWRTLSHAYQAEQPLRDPTWSAAARRVCFPSGLRGRVAGLAAPELALVVFPSTMTNLQQTSGLAAGHEVAQRAHVGPVERHAGADGAGRLVPGSPADLVVLIAAPTGEDDLHVTLLSRLARKLVHQSFRESLREAPTADEALRDARGRSKSCSLRGC